MAKKTRSLDHESIDVVEAVKRAFIRRGIVPKRRRTVAASKSEIESSDDTPPTSQRATEAPMTMQAKSKEIEPAEGPEKLVDLTANAHEILFEASTVFPFTLFPDTITLDREKITIANRAFFKVATISSVPIIDVQSIQANVGPFFGSITLLRMNITPISIPLIVKFLWRDDAIKVQHLLQGYIIAHQKKVDCATIDKEQLIILLNDLGQGVSD